MAVPARIGRYEIELVLGHGAFWRVFLARDSALGRQVAVKALRDDLDWTPQTRAEIADQIRNAARATAALSHPGISALHDIGEDAVLGVYVVSELVKGLTLRERIARGRLLRGEAAALARSLGSALAYAHAEGLVHGSFKPESVLLSGTGPKIVDLGFPGWLPAGSPPPAAVEGAALETHAYSAPEVVASGVPTARGDQYSLAATLYEGLTGKSATGGAPSGGAKLRTPFGLLPELGGAAHVDAIFDCALAKDPRRRFPSCEVLGDSLAEALEAVHATSPLPPTSQSSIVPRATRRWQNAVAGAAVLVIFALVGLGGERHGTKEGISLKSVARAFSGTFPSPRGPSSAATNAPVPEHGRSSSALSGASQVPSAEGR